MVLFCGGTAFIGCCAALQILFLLLIRKVPGVSIAYGQKRTNL